VAPRLMGSCFRHHCPVRTQLVGWHSLTFLDLLPMGEGLRAAVMRRRPVRTQPATEAAAREAFACGKGGIV
jgi:hypothetical protein